MTSLPAPPAALPARPGPLLTLNGLGCRRGERQLFNGVDAVVAPGQVLWVRGANGRGKTSLLRLLTGLSTPAGGEIRWNGRSLRSAGAEYRHRMLYLGHANGLKEDLTVLESLAFLARIHGRPCEPQALSDALDNLGLSSRHDAPIRTLSQGQRRRVALARLALDLMSVEAGASIWLLDEPYDALDGQGIVTLDALLGAQARRGGCVVLTSHLPLTLRDPEPIPLLLDVHAPIRRASAEGRHAPGPA